MKTAVKEFIIGERNHYIIFSSLGFLAGCVCYPWLRFGLWVWIWLALSVAFGVVLHFMGKRPTIALMLLFFSLGMIRTNIPYSVTIPAVGKHEIKAYVSGDVKAKGWRKKSFRLTGLLIDGEPANMDAYCSLNGKYLEEDYPELYDGALISFRGRVYEPQGSDGTPHFDFRKWMYENNMPIGISTMEAITVENTKETAPVIDVASRIRNAIRARLEIVMGKRSSIAMALLFGDKTGLSDEEYASFQKLGIAHLMSVSGLHIGIMAGLLMKLFKLCRMNRKIRFPIVVVFLFAYSALCGFSPASLRAAIMFSLLQFAELFFRARDRLTILSLSALVILLVNPLDATSAGFVLSFSAMGGIYGITPAIQDLWQKVWPLPHYAAGHHTKARIRRRLRKLQKGFQDVFSLSLGAQLGTLIPTIVFFHQVPTYGLLVNLLMVPFVGTILTPFLFVTTLLCYIPGLSQAMGFCGAGLSDLLLNVVAWLSKLPGALIRVGMPNRFLIIGLVAAALILTRLIPGPFRLKSIVAAAFLVVFIGLSFLDAPASLRYIQIAVGQADSAIIMDGRQTIVIDAGEEGDELMDYLLYEGRNIDTLIITHPHNDHIAGVAKLLEENIRIGKVYLPVSYQNTVADSSAEAILRQLSDKGVPILELGEGDSLTFQRCEIRSLWPRKGEVRLGSDANDASMALYIRLGNYSLLHMGDLGEDYEEYAALPANVLKVAHHGSATSSKETFLQMVQPDCAIISCDVSGQLPAASTVNRILDRGIKLLRTDENGDISIIPKENELIIQAYRGEFSQ